MIQSVVPVLATTPVLLPYPVCQRQVSSAAASCPGCGHPLAQPLAPPAAAKPVPVVPVPVAPCDHSDTTPELPPRVVRNLLIPALVALGILVAVSLVTQSFTWWSDFFGRAERDKSSLTAANYPGPWQHDPPPGLLETIKIHVTCRPETIRYRPRRLNSFPTGEYLVTCSMAWDSKGENSYMLAWPTEKRLRSVQPPQALK